MFYLYKLRTAVVLAAVLALINTGCLKDSCQVTIPSTIYTPVYKPLAEIRAAIKSETPRDIKETGKIYLYGRYIFLNEPGQGIHVIDNTDPAAPRKVSFINIPGNVDMAVKNNIMYVDSHIDLVALDITEPTHIREVGRVKGAYPFSNYQYGYLSDTSRGLIVDYLKRDTVLSNTCSMPGWNGEYVYNAASNTAVFANSSKSAAPSVGKAGSTARFGLLNNYLYTVSSFSITPFNIEQPASPQAKLAVHLSGFVVETIFPYKDHLFMGTTTGMLIYDVVNPELPARKAIFSHLRACDPVVVEDNIAYVTVRSGTACNTQAVNELQVINVEDPELPVMVKNYTMTSPYGLGINKGNLFIGEGDNGLRFLDAKDHTDIKTLLSLRNVKAFDIIPETDNVVLVVAEDGLYQYDYSNMNAPKQLSKISIAAKK